MNSCIGENEYNRFLEGSLSEKELIQLEDHVRTCGYCRAEFEKWAELKAAFLSVSGIDAPQTLKGRVMQEIRKAKICPARPAAGILNLNRILAAVFLAFSIGLCIWPYFSPYDGSLFEETVKYLSQLIYNLAGFLGLDMGEAMPLFRTAMPLMNGLLWVFLINTLMLLAGFCICVMIGRRTRRKLTNQ